MIIRDNRNDLVRLVKERNLEYVEVNAWIAAAFLNRSDTMEEMHKAQTERELEFKAAAQKVRRPV